MNVAITGIDPRGHALPDSLVYAPNEPHGVELWRTYTQHWYVCHRHPDDATRMQGYPRDAFEIAFRAFLRRAAYDEGQRSGGPVDGGV